MNMIESRVDFSHTYNENCENSYIGTELFFQQPTRPYLMKHGILFLDANFAKINFAKVP